MKPRCPWILLFKPLLFDLATDSAGEMGGIERSDKTYSGHSPGTQETL